MALLAVCMLHILYCEKLWSRVEAVECAVMREKEGVKLRDEVAKDLIWEVLSEPRR
jgi:hypothetical protein